MPRGRADLKLGRGPEARYATVVVDVTNKVIPVTRGVPILITLAKSFGRFDAALAFGASYAAQFVPIARVRKGIEITIMDLVDTIGTTDVMVVLATARAVWKAVDYRPAMEPYVDEASGGITFPLALSPGAEEEESHHLS